MGGKNSKPAAASAEWDGVAQKPKETILRELLTAVANGMESASVNINPLTGNSFIQDQENEQIDPDVIERRHLFAEDLLKKSPELLLERIPFKD